MRAVRTRLSALVHAKGLYGKQTKQNSRNFDSIKVKQRKLSTPRCSVVVTIGCHREITVREITTRARLSAPVRPANRLYYSFKKKFINFD